VTVGQGRAEASEQPDDLGPQRQRVRQNERERATRATDASELVGSQPPRGGFFDLAGLEKRTPPPPQRGPMCAHQRANVGGLVVGASEQPALEPDDKIDLVDKVQFVHASLSLLSKCRATAARKLPTRSTGGPPTETPKWRAAPAEEKERRKGAGQVHTTTQDPQRQAAWQQAQEWVSAHEGQVTAMARKRGLDPAETRQEVLMHLAERAFATTEAGKEVRPGLLGLAARDAVVKLADRLTLSPPRETRNTRRQRWDATHGVPKTDAEREARERAAWHGARKRVAAEPEVIERFAAEGSDPAAVVETGGCEWGAAALAIVHRRLNLSALAQALRDGGERAAQRWLVDWQRDVLAEMSPTERARLARDVAARLGAPTEIRADRVAAWGRAQVEAEVRWRAESERATWRRQWEVARQRERGELAPVEFEWDEHGMGRLVFDDVPAAAGGASRPERTARTAARAAKTRDNRPAPAMVSLFEAFPEVSPAATLELRPA